MSISLIVYIVLASLILLWIANAPYVPTSLDPEKPSVWENPMWYILIMLLVIVGIVINAVTK